MILKECLLEKSLDRLDGLFIVMIFQEPNDLVRIFKDPKKNPLKGPMNHCKN